MTKMLHSYNKNHDLEWIIDDSDRDGGAHSIYRNNRFSTRVNACVEDELVL